MANFSFLALLVCAIIAYSFGLYVCVALQHAKIVVLRSIVKARAYANSEHGERRIVNALTGMACVAALSFALLIIGYSNI